jgi:hypothetical protein
MNILFNLRFNAHLDDYTLFIKEYTFTHGETHSYPTRHMQVQVIDSLTSVMPGIDLTGTQFFSSLTYDNIALEALLC